MASITTTRSRPPVLDGHDRVAEVDVGAVQVVQHHLARRTACGGDGLHHRAESAQHLGGVLERLVRHVAITHP